MRVSRAVSILLFAASAAAHAQYVNFYAPGTPLNRNGKPNLNAPVPRAANGRPDLSGVWQATSAPLKELASMLPPGAPLDQDHPFNGLGEDEPSRYFLNILADFKPEEAPMQPAAAAVFLKNLQGFGKDGPATHCLPAGLPLTDVQPAPYKIVQTSGLVVVLSEGDASYRQIFTDGRAHPKNQEPSWFGYSTGKWEGDTLVVDTVGFNDKGWLDAMGHTHSDAMHLTERFRRLDYGHMEIQLTIDDPKTFTKPVTVRVSQLLRPDSDLIEYFCLENEKDVAHFGK